MTFLQFTTALLWLLTAAQGIQLYRTHGLRKTYKTAIDELERMTAHGALPPGVVEELHRAAMSAIGLDTDLLERILVDIAFLHSERYGERDPHHSCPVCGVTVPEIEKLMESLRHLHISIDSKRTSGD